MIFYVSHISNISDVFYSPYIAYIFLNLLLPYIFYISWNPVSLTYSESQDLLMSITSPVSFSFVGLVRFFRTILYNTNANVRTSNTFSVLTIGPDHSSRLIMLHSAIHLYIIYPLSGNRLCWWLLTRRVILQQSGLCCQWLEFLVQPFQTWLANMYYRYSSHGEKVIDCWLITRGKYKLVNIIGGKMYCAQGRIIWEKI